MGAELERDSADPTPPIPRLCRYLSERSPLPVVAVEGATHVVSYLNPAFARLVGKERKELVGRMVAEAVPEGEGNGCLALLDRVYRTGVPEDLAEQEHSQNSPGPAYWSYAVWPILGEDGSPAGVVLQVTDSTETAVYRRRAREMNEALLISATRQHALAADAESLNARLRDAHDRLEGRVAERTAELAAANASLRAEIGVREAAEADRQELLRRLGTAQEDERRRISRELHDQMGQLLAALGLGLKALEAATPATSPGRPHLARLRELTDQVGREFHRLALDLRPTALDDLGLRTALATYTEAWSERSGVAVDFQSTVADAERLPGASETALYRIVQEALTNVFKHAHARRVSVVLLRSVQQVSAVVEDDGRGFDPDLKPGFADGRRLGILGMRERAASVGGSLLVESSPGQGATVIIRIPLPDSGEEAGDG
jgi:PAS domain S-box-containing protein